MSQYLLNATAIWLLSLVVFDLFLRRESFHSYNRFYVLFTMALGIVLPLVKWKENAAHSYPGVLQRPLEGIVTVKQNIAAAQIPHASFDWMMILGIVYISGAGIALLLLIKDSIRLAVFTMSGTKTKVGPWTIIETNKQHAPFSFLHTLFVSARAQYSGAEWTMILQHEARHTTLVHLADLLFINIACIVFWFHPLVYVYRKRLLMIHEFQADTVAGAQPQQYSHFLIEQALLPSAPVLSHSFNRSPIKNRIVMLTRKSSFISKGKMLLFIPLTLVCITCFSQDATSGYFDWKDNIAIRKGSQFEMSEQTYDTVTLIDPVNGTESTQVRINDREPLKLNGKKILNMEDAEKQAASLVLGDNNDRYFTYLMNNLKPLLNQLGDGKYRITPMTAIVNVKGQLAYFEHRGITRTQWDDKLPAEQQMINKQLAEAIDKRTARLLEHCPDPGKLNINGQNVPYALGNLIVSVKDHQLNAQ